VAIAAVVVGAQITTGFAATGSWTIVPSPNPPASLATLTSLSCPAATSCFAAGDAFAHGNDRSLVEHWDGSAWSVTPTPGLNVVGGLDAVSCVSVRFCNAVGTRFVGGTGPAHTLVVLWDGSSWSQIPSPTPGQEAGLNGVSCASTSNCVAVGESTVASGSEHTLIEAWNGTRWSVIASPSPRGGSSSLSSVTCLETSSCFSVGEHRTSQQRSRTLIERWDGRSWTIVPSPNVGGSSMSQLSGVACTGMTACVAIGSSVGAEGSATLAEGWDGGAWRIAPSANPLSGSGTLLGVSCTHATDCVAVGVGTTDVGTSASIIEQWQGTRWALTGHPSPKPSKGSVLIGVACEVGTACIAVGYNFLTVSTQATLVEQESR
jgi:hypothetical protein